MTEVVIIESPIHGERVWRRVGERRGARPSGRLTIWQGECVICGRAFEIATFGRDEFSTLTCPAHRLTAAERRRLFRGDDECRRRVFEEIRREKLAADDSRAPRLSGPAE
jgi:hypothetical protein